MVHAIDRAKERYGIDLSISDLRMLQQKIIDGDGILRARDAVCEHWIVMHDGVALNAVFSTTKKIIITFNPTNGKLRGGKWPKRKSRVTADERRPRLNDRIELE